jgi:hypothetical protein
MYQFVKYLQIMKTKNIFTALLLAVLSIATLFTSCNKESETNPVIRFENLKTLRQTIFADEIIVPQVIKFTTTEAWTSSISVLPNSQLKGDEPDWILMSPRQGSAAGDYSLTIALGVNATGVDRTAVIMLTVEKSLTSITITQKGTTATGSVPTTPTVPTLPTNPTNPTNPGNTTHNMTGKINGTAFAWNGDAEIADNMIMLGAGSETDVPYILFMIPENATAGQTYSITSEGNCNALLMTEDDMFDIETGSLSITEHNTAQGRITGTFSFSTEGYSVTEGTFDFTYSAAPYFIKATVNNVEYSETAVSASVDGGTGTRISVSALVLSENTPVMYISFPEGTSAGTYTITGDAFADYSASYNNIRATSGTLTITSSDLVTQIVKGTFSFVAGDYTVTNGEFEAELP